MFKVTKKLLFATSPQLLYSLVVIQIYSILVCYPEEESEMSSDINTALKKQYMKVNAAPYIRYRLL